MFKSKSRCGGCVREFWFIGYEEHNPDIGIEVFDDGSGAVVTAHPEMDMPRSPDDFRELARALLEAADLWDSFRAKTQATDDSSATRSGGS